MKYTITTKTESRKMKTERHDEIKAACLFLADYAAAMLACGASCIRTQKNVGRIAQAYRLSARMIILPNTVDICVWDSSRTHSYKESVAVPDRPVSFAVNTRLSNLSWRIFERKIPLPLAVRCFNRILTTPPVAKWLVLILVAAANAAFCRLFGGDFPSVAIVGFATLVGYYLKIIMLDAKSDTRIVFICCAFVSAVAGAAGYVFHIGGTPELALGTSVLYLIPGIPYINSVTDMLEGHHLCAFSRFVNASILTACIAIGLTGGFLIMNIELF